MAAGEILLYQNQDGTIKIDVRLADGSVWLTQERGGVVRQRQKRPISVGYRVKSPQGTQFRLWATQRLKGHRIGPMPPKSRRSC